MDIDLPRQNFSFQLVGDVPAGAVISAVGVVTWTPTTLQALKNYSLLVAVTDTGTPPATATKIVNVYVHEPQSTGFTSVPITTTNGPVTVVVPRKEYQFTAWNRTLYVAVNGSDTNAGTFEQPWRTFTNSIARLQAGDVLYVRGGEYAEPFEVTKSGTRGKPIVISAYPGERVRIVQPDGWQAAHPNGSTVVIGWGTKHVWFHGFEVEGGQRAGMPHSNGNGRNGISLSGPVEGCRIINNLVSRALDAGIDAGRNNSGADYVIEGNAIWECGHPWLGAGINIALSGHVGAIVRGNAIVRCGIGINLWGYGDANVVVERVHVYNNLVVQSGPYGISLRSSGRNIVAHNVFAAHTAAGLMITNDSDTNSIVNNIFLDNSPRHLLYDSASGANKARPANIIFDYTVFDPRSDLAFPLDWFTPLLGTHVVHADPLFVDAQNFDFRLQATSPARNAAGPLSLPGTLPVRDIGLFSATNYWEPEMVGVPDLEVNELEELNYSLRLAVTNASVTSLKFELLEGSPEGAYIDSRTGHFTWKPSEFQGSGDYTVKVHVTADESPLLTSTAGFGIRVRELNSAPVIGTVKAQTIVEGTRFELNLGNPNIGTSPGLLWEVFSGISGTQLSDLTFFTKYPSYPDRSDVLRTGFEAPRDVGDNYGQRLRGFIIPPQSGNYRFWIASDDQSVLYLSSDESLVNARPIAWVNDWTSSREWTKEPNQRSAPISLVAGEQYYIEAVMKEGGGGDNLAVRWELPNGTFETPIPASRLLPWEKEISFANSFVSGGSIGLRRGVWFSYQSTDTLAAITNSIEVLNSPHRSDLLLNYFETLPNVTDNPGLRRWAQRVHALLIPPQTGDYTFYVSAGGDSVLYLSSDDSPQNAKPIASVQDGTTRREWNKSPLQTSAPQHLQQAKRYYIEAISIADRDQDHLAVGWQLPDGRIEAPMPASRLTVGWNPVFASDPDQPAGKLTYTLAAGAPSGLEIDRTSGRLTWIPSEAQGPGTYPITVRVTDNGDPALAAATTFDVTVEELNSPPLLQDITGQIAAEGSPFTLTAAAKDGDVPANPLTFSLVSGPKGMDISATTGTISWSPEETTGGRSFPVTIRVNDNGIPPLIDTRTFSVNVAEVNAVPALMPIADQTIKAMTPLNFTANASDPDIPADTLSFSLEAGAPSGATIDPLTGLFSWTPSATSRSTNVITIRVTDNGVPPQTATGSFTVIAIPSNIAPVLSAILDRTIPEEGLFVFQAAASDADLPKQKLTYSLEEAPNRAAINPSTGEFSWTPTEAQGPGTYRILVRVSDDGLPSLSDEKTFTLTVSEINQAPVLTVIADQTITESATLTLIAAAADLDVQQNKLAFELLNGPVGMTLDAITGGLVWTPEMSQVASTNQITIIVTDQGIPPLSDMKSFSVIVQPKVAAPAKITSARLLPDDRFIFEFDGEPGKSYTIEASSDLIAWVPVNTASADAQGNAEFSESLTRKFSSRYYRVVIEAAR